jgi:hypothetical protein
MLDLSPERHLAESWEQRDGWVPAVAGGTLTSTTDKSHSGRHSARIEYRFPTVDNDYVAFRPAQTMELGRPHSVGLWVSGNNSGHLVQIQLKDETGEVLQFPLGIVGGSDWTWMQAPVTGRPSAGNRLGGGDNNGRLDGSISVHALVVDDQPNTARVRGTIWVDDLTAIGGDEVYAFRWSTADETIDVAYAPNGAYADIATSSSRATIVDRDGNRTQITAKDGTLTVALSARPRYIRHRAP